MNRRKYDTSSSYCIVGDDNQLIERVCTKCLQLKTRDEFYKLAHGPGGYQTLCKKCNHSSSVKSQKRSKRRNKVSPEAHLKEHNQKQLSKSTGGEFKLSNVKTRSTSPGLLIQEAHPGTSIVCLKERIQGVTHITLLDVAMDDETLMEMLLHNHWKIQSVVRDLESDWVQEITRVENSRRLPFTRDSIFTMLSSHTYYLWMTNPRSLDLDEISEIYSIPKSSLEFLFTAEKLALPPGGDISGDNSEEKNNAKD